MIEKILLTLTTALYIAQSNSRASQECDENNNKFTEKQQDKKWENKKWKDEEFIKPDWAAITRWN